MTLPSATPIKMSDVRTELGRAAGTQTSLGETAVRALAGKPSGTISIKDLLGKSASATLITTPTNKSSYTYSATNNAKLSLDIIIDGTWEVVGAGDGSSAVEDSGRWASSTVNPADYEIVCSAATSSGATIDVWSVGTSWVGITTLPISACYLNVTPKTAGTQQTSTLSFTVSIRKKNTTTPVFTFTTQFKCTAIGGSIVG